MDNNLWLLGIDIYSIDDAIGTLGIFYYIKMSRPHIHKKRILKLLEKLRYELSLVYEEHHVEFPNKEMHEVEIDINNVLQEVERVDFVPKSK